MEEHKHEHKHKTGIKKTTLWKVAAVVFAALFVITLIFAFKGPSAKKMPMDQAANKSIAYLNDYLLQGSGQTATLKFIKQEGDIYAMNITVGGKEYKSYVTTDGNLLFPSVIELNNIPKDDTTQTPPAETPKEMPKTGKPVVELFVMSHCPYGTQIEKGMIPVAELLGNKIDFNIKFVYYAMHGEKEVDEQLQQYCIETEQNDKYFTYLKCFLKDGNAAPCLTEAEVDATKLAACVKATDEKYSVKKNFADQSTWLNGRFPKFDIFKADNEKYSVGGSPTLIINGAEASAGRDSASLLKAVCGAFTTEPAECKQTLSAAQPSPGFGYNTAAANTAGAQCNT